MVFDAIPVLDAALIVIVSGSTDWGSHGSSAQSQYGARR